MCGLRGWGKRVCAARGPFEPPTPSPLGSNVRQPETDEEGLRLGFWGHPHIHTPPPSAREHGLVQARSGC